MKNMVIVETRDPIEVRDVEWSAELLAQVRGAGAASTLMLAANGVLGARASAPAPFLTRLIGQGVDVLADRFALAERGITEADLAPGIAGADLGVVVDWLAAGDHVLWR
jgi:hypothetical protein